MDTTFSMSRFLQVMKNEWSLTWKKMLLFWGGITVVVALYIAYFGLINRDLILISQVENLLFLFMCIVQGFYFQIYFREFASKKKTQSLLLLPTSRNETFLAKILFGSIPYLLMIIVIAIVATKWVEIQNVWVKEMLNLPADDRRVLNFENAYQISGLERSVLLTFFPIWTFAASIQLFGIVSFKRVAALKSIALLFLVFVGMTLAVFVLYFLFTGIMPNFASPIDHIHVFGSGNAHFLRAYPAAMFCSFLFISLFLTFISYVKYNEKTI